MTPRRRGVEKKTFMPEVTRFQAPACPLGAALGMRVESTRMAESTKPTEVGGLLVLNSVDEPERYSTYFMKIDGVKFRQKVVPGDTLLFRVELLAPIRRGISTMKGYAFVGEKSFAKQNSWHK